MTITFILKMIMNRYEKIIQKFKSNQLVLLDGGIGTELEKRGLKMDATWCGSSSLQTQILTKLHMDYINAGSNIITTNTYASSRIMLESGNFGNKFHEINIKAIECAKNAREILNKKDVLIAGSISHRYPIADGDLNSNASINVSDSQLKESCEEMSKLLCDNGCDIILLEMMYHPERMQIVFDSIKNINKPVWVGFSARKSDDNKILSLSDSINLPFNELIQIIKYYHIDCVGIMHTSLDIIGECIEIIKQNFSGPLMVYPDSGKFISPNWIFDEIISPKEFSLLAKGWFNIGVQVIGGCCGLSPEHIQAVYKSEYLKQ